MQHRVTGRAVAGFLILAAAATALAQGTPPAGAPAGPAVATVGGRRISRAEFEQRSEQALREFRARGGKPVPGDVEALLERQLLESLVRRELLVLEAKRRNILVSDAEAEAQLRKDPFFNPGGRFDETRWAGVRTAQPAEFARVLGEVKATLAAQKLSRQVEREHQPSEAQLRAQVERATARADVEYLALRIGDFPGGYPEPRESDLIAYWRAHPDEFRRSARATLSLIGVLGGPAESDRLRRRADSLLAALRSGGSWDVAARAMNHERNGITVLPDNFPGDWLGDAATRAAVFRQAKGALLAEPVRARDGWFVVRVDEVSPERVAPLREVAREIRGKLRAEAREHSAERALRTLYDARRDSLAREAVRVRWVVVDTAAVEPGRPGAAEIERYYRGHLADYSRFDNVQGRVVEQPLAEVRDEVERRWRSDRRLELARERAARIEAAWRRNRRDAAAERGLAVREGDPLVPGAIPDPSPAGRVLGDSIARRNGALGTGVARVPQGPLVFHVHDRVARYLPSFESMRPLIEAIAAEERDRADEAGARALYDADPAAFATGRTVHSTRMVVPPPDPLTIKLTRRDVERWHRANLDKYSAPEQVRASHILIAPADGSEAAHGAARARADSLRRALVAGADFAALARRFSDDEPTRASGGELGTFGHGVVLEELEKAAFALRSGDLSDVVKSPEGYHLLQVHEYLPPVVQPLALMYSNVGLDAATARADTIVRHRADSLRRSFRTTAQARAVGQRLGYEMIRVRHTQGESPGVAALTEYFATLDQVPPGRFYPTPVFIRGQGWVVSWVDSVTPPRAPSWEDARAAALERYRRGAGMRALEAKVAELDSLLASGVSPDSVATLFGGWERVAELRPRAGLPGLGGGARVDSLVFGTAAKPAALEPGQLSGWLPFQAGRARLRVVEVDRAEPGQLQSRIAAERRNALEHNLYGYYERLKQRHPVRILDPRLREIELPAPPPQ